MERHGYSRVWGTHRGLATAIEDGDGRKGDLRRGAGNISKIRDGDGDGVSLPDDDVPIDILTINSSSLLTFGSNLASVRCFISLLDAVTTKGSY